MEDLIDEGYNWYDKGNYSKAIEFVDKAIDIDVKSPFSSNHNFTVYLIFNFCKAISGQDIVHC